jgi:hypothetical protein
MEGARVDPNDDLPPIASLTPASDFKPFLRHGVASQARNAALKKLFTDPHYNVMDGLDVYIEDYNLTEPIPEHVLARLLREHASPVLAATGQPGSVDEAGELVNVEENDALSDVARDQAGISRAGIPADLEDPVGADGKSSPAETALADETAIPGETPVADRKASPGVSLIVDRKACTGETASAGDKQGVGETRLAEDRLGRENRSLEPVVASGTISRTPDDRPIEERR